MNIDNALNKRLALILWAKDENDEDDVAVISGVFVRDREIYYLKREGNETNPEIRYEWLDRIKEVPVDLKETLLDCDYQISFTVGRSDEYEGEAPLESFGIKWPAD